MYWILVSTHFSAFASLGSVYSWHRIAIVSYRFSTFTSLIRAISNILIVLDSGRFSTFPSLVQRRIFSIIQPGAIWRKASAKISVKSSSSSTGFLRSLVVSIRGRNLPRIIYFSGRPRKVSWSRCPPLLWSWTHLLSSILPTQLPQHFLLRNTCVIFN